MLRAILSVIIGYIVMAIIVAIAFTIMQLALGTESVFKPASWEPSTLFVACALVISIIAAIVGGLVCAAIARTGTPVKALAGIVLVIGLISAALQMSLPAPGPRPAEVSPMDSASNARSPMWYNFTLPFIGAAGVIIGGALMRKTPAP